MDIWAVALVAIGLTAVAALVSVVTSRRSAAQPPRHTLGEKLVARLIAVIVLTPLAVSARIEWGSVAAVIVAAVGVAGFAYWLTARGYAGWPYVWPSHAR